jgi:rhodanese-related sulfurtransferase
MKLYLNKILYICIFIICATSSCASETNDIDNQELKQLMHEGVVVIDVRATSEWQKTGVIEGSHLVMFYDENGKYDIDAWLADVANVADKNQPVVLICHSGGRSKELSKYLVKEGGYEMVYNVKKGITSWIKQNNFVVAPK